MSDSRVGDVAMSDSRVGDAAMSDSRVGDVAWVKLGLCVCISHLGENMRSLECVPHVSKMMMVNLVLYDYIFSLREKLRS
jgi:hypothetical protein